MLKSMAFNSKAQKSLEPMEWKILLHKSSVIIQTLKTAFSATLLPIVVAWSVTSHGESGLLPCLPLTYRMWQK